MSSFPETEAELIKAIDATHPVITGRNDLREKAEELLNHRKNPESVIELVYFLLYTIDKNSKK